MYDFKLLQEMAWVAFIAAVITVLTAIADPSSLSDPETWLLNTGFSALRAAAAAVLAMLKPRSS